MKISKIAMLVVIGTLLAGKGFASVEEREAAIAERIKPVGDVCIEGDESCAGAVVAAASDEPRSGKEVFNATCTGCHSTGAAGAPKVGDAADWAARKKVGGLEGLYKHAKDGFNGMPPKGLCMDCSDEEITATVDYMLSL